MVFTNTTKSPLHFTDSRHHWGVECMYTPPYLIALLASSPETPAPWHYQRTVNEHVLHSLLSPPSASQYNLRHRPHNRLLCQRASRLTDCNFIRMLYSDMYWLTLCTFYCFVFVSHVEVRFDISVIKELIDWLRHRQAGRKTDRHRQKNGTDR